MVAGVFGVVGCAAESGDGPAGGAADSGVGDASVGGGLDGGGDAGGGGAAGAADGAVGPATDVGIVDGAADDAGPGGGGSGDGGPGDGGPGDGGVADTSDPSDGAAGADGDAGTGDAGGPADTSWLACPEQPAEQPIGPFRREGDAVVDAFGRGVVLHGVNVSNASKYSADLMTWHGPEDFAALASIGLDHVRLLVAWAGVSPEEGVVDAAYLDALAERVDWAADAGLLVILDMHQDVFGYGFGGNGAPRWACTEERYAAHEPKEPWFRNYLSPQVQQCFDRLYYEDAAFAGLRDAWVAVAARFADHPAVLGFDLLNEPHWGTHSAETFVSDIWQRRQEELGAALRAVAPGRIVWLQGTTLVNMGSVQPFATACHDGTGFAPHYYHPLVHDGYPYSAALAPQLTLALDAIAGSAANLGGVPVWLGEIGAFPNAPTTPAYLHDLLGMLAERRWGWAWWADDKGDEGFALRHEDGSFQEAVVGIVGHPYARRVPGPLEAQAMDFVAEQYTARFAWTVDAPLEVWAGAPDGGAPWVVTLAPVDGGGVVPCVQRPGASAGLLDCGPPLALGAAFEVQIVR